MICRAEIFRRETAAQENSSCYFPVLDRIADGYFKQGATDQELYTSFLKLLEDDGHLADPDSVSSFKLALSLRSAAPRIEAHYQYYNTSVESSLKGEQGEGCDVWVHFAGKRYCSPELEKEHDEVSHSRYVALHGRIWQIVLTT